MYYSDSCTQAPDGFIDVEPIDLTPPKNSFWRELLCIPPKSASAQVREKLEDEQCRALFTKVVLEHGTGTADGQYHAPSGNPVSGAH